MGGSKVENNGFAENLDISTGLEYHEKEAICLFWKVDILIYWWVLNENICAVAFGLARFFIIVQNGPADLPTPISDFFLVRVVLALVKCGSHKGSYIQQMGCRFTS